jgi:hypothetical protein
MSRTQKLILAGLALLDVIVLCALLVAVISSMRSLPMPTERAAAPTATILPTPTRFPTWTPPFTPTPHPTGTARPTGTATGTPTPRAALPTATPTVIPSPTPTPTLTATAKLLENPAFDDIEENAIPGWQTGAHVNWEPGVELDPANSYAAPRFHAADDPEQHIFGSTLQIDTVDWVKLRAWVYQTVTVKSGSRVTFQVRAAAVVHDQAGGYFLKAGIDPDGNDGCDEAQWGEERHVNQRDGVVTLVSPEVVVEEERLVTVCMFAETQYAQVWHAAFFDEAELLVLPREEGE